MNDAPISEIYVSHQGEGLYTGERQVFVRLAGCPLRCDYCDTPGSLTAEGHPRKSVNSVAQEVLRLANQESTRTICFTGGEPLTYGRFLQKLIPLLKEQGCKIYLETAGIHAEALDLILSDVDIIAMDIKLPSAVGKSYWEEHRTFLQKAGKKAFVKIVIEAATSKEELDQAVKIVSSVNPVPSLVLQPMTAIPNGPVLPTQEKIQSFYQDIRNQLPHVYLMVQQHKIWGVR